MSTQLQVLVIDIGGTHVKAAHTGSSTTEAFASTLAVQSCRAWWTRQA